MSQKIAKPEMLRYAHVLILRGDLNEALGSLILIGEHPPPLFRPESNSVRTHGSTNLVAERAHGDDRESTELARARHFLDLRNCAGCVTQVAGYGRYSHRARRNNEPSEQFSALAGQSSDYFAQTRAVDHRHSDQRGDVGIHS